MRVTKLTIQFDEETLSDGTPVWVGLCKELDIASQGATIEEAKQNVLDAIDLFLGDASPNELEWRMPPELKNVFTTGIEVPFGQAQGLVGSGSR